jgi:serine protease Do
MRVPRFAVAAVALLALSLGSPFPAAGQALPRDVRLRIVGAVVQIIPYDPVTDAGVDWSGSGTIISPDGYILTNFHVVGEPDQRTHYEWHAIFTTDPSFTDQPPKFTYWARYVAGDPTYDLAVLKIEEYADQTPVPDGTIFPYVPVGDSNRLIPGDGLTIVGYPGISGATITFTFGLMSGWLGEDFESGGKQWIKTDAKIAHGNSGGAAFDASGTLIGVPTAGRTVSYGDLDTEVQAYVRPIGLAWALVGPNVPTVARAGSTATPTRSAPQANGAGGATSGTNGSGAGSAATPAPASTAGAAALAADCTNCIVGDLRLGGIASGRIAGAPDAAQYQTYRVSVPAGTPQLVIEMSADGDLDVAAKYGAEIDSYADDGNWDYMDGAEAHDARLVIPNPTAGTWYIDVFNQLDKTSATYTMLIQ